MRLHRNPIARAGDFADPFALRHDGRYYLYATNPDVRCWSSDDLLQWRPEGPTIAEDVFPGLVPFAPEVVYDNGAFFMYTSPSGQGHIVLRAESPTGPFVPVTGNVEHAIDGNVFVDDDGSRYFYWAGDEGIWGCPMPSPTEFGEPVLTGMHMNGWTEGPFVSKRNGVYQMTLTGNHYLSPGYRIDVAYSDHPLTGFRPGPLNPVVVGADGPAIGLGHSSSVLGPDLVSTWMIYHNLNPDASRDLDIDRQLGDGPDLVVLGPTTSAPAPVGPDVAWRGDAATPLPTGPFTAELTLTAADDEYALHIGTAVTVRVERAAGTVRATAVGSDVVSSLPAGYRHDVAHCWTLVAHATGLRVHVDGRRQLDISLPAGTIAGELTVRGATTGYGALTRSTTELADAAAVKPVPGRFWATGHAAGGIEPVEHTLHVQHPGPVGVHLAGEFSPGDVVRVAVDDVEREVAATRDCRLISADFDLAADSARFAVRPVAGRPCVRLVTIARAATGSAAEFADERQSGWGKRRLGDETWDDVELTARLAIAFDAGTGHADLLLRATQLAEGGEGDDSRLGIDFLLGYSVQLHQGRIVLARHAYDTTVLASCATPVLSDHLDLVVRATGSELSVRLADEVILRVDDELPYPVGAVGLRTADARLHVAQLRLERIGRQQEQSMIGKEQGQ